MTWSDEVVDNEEMTAGDKFSSDPQSVGDMLVQTLAIVQRHNSRRVACGLLQCANILEHCPDKVMMGIMPMSQSTMEHIEQVLLEAFFRERGICLIKVDSASKLADVVQQSPTDVSCVLVLHAPNRRRVITEEEATLTQLCMREGLIWPPPVAELPGGP